MYSRLLKVLCPALVLLLVGWFARPMLQGAPARQEAIETAAPTAIAPAAIEAREVAWQVEKSFPHDRNAFLQGLLWHDGGFYESTGLEGRSTLRRVEFPSGKVVRKRDLPRDVFGEGLAMWDGKLIQLTWQSRTGYIWEPQTFRLLRQWSYQTEGWGLTNNDQNLILSDGSDTLFFLDPQTFSVVRELKVTMNGRPLRHLNELEWIEGEIWANIWQTDLIVRIKPKTGVVQSFLNLAGLLPTHLRTGREDVLNGIAYDAKTKRIFLGGKFWPRIFQIKLREAA